MNSLLSFDVFALGIYAAVLYVSLLWIALIVWVTRDIVGRTKSITLQVICIVLVAALHGFGAVLYLLLRPPKTLSERYFEHAELHLLNQSKKTKDPGSS